MTKKTSYLIFILIFTLLVACSFDNKSGIWSGTEEEKRRADELEIQQKQKIDTVKIFSSESFYKEEISSNANISLTEPVKNSSWQMAGFNQQNFVGNIFLSSVNNNFLKKKIGKNKFSISKVLSSPLIVDDNIIFSDDTGTIFNINKKGKINWKKNIYKKIYKKIYKNLTFIIYKNHIYIADNIGFIYKITLENGELVWIKNHGIPLKSNIKIFNNNIFLINQDNRILCLDTENGLKAWDVRTVSSFIKSQNFLALAVSRKGEIFVLNSSGDLLKINSKNGSVNWSLSAIGSMYAHDTDFFKSSNIVIDDGTIIFATSNSVFSFNSANGYLNWKKNIGSKNTPIIVGNNVFLVSDNGYFVNLDKKLGKIIWSTNILKILKKKKRLTQITGFIMGSGKIYATTYNGHLIVSSAVSGKTEYYKKIGDPITAAPIISNNSLYILTEHSRILGFN